jgi:hypothetical protein
MADRGEEKAIHLVEVPAGEEVAFGISAKVQEGMSLQVDQKGMQGQGKAPVAPPPKPSDSAVSAKPKK